MDQSELTSTPKRNNLKDDNVIRSHSTSSTGSFGRKKAMSVSLTMTPKGYKMNNPHKTPTSTPKITKTPSTVGTQKSSNAMNRRSMILSRSDVDNALKFSIYISDKLILKKSGEKDLKSVKTLKISNREGSIKTIEGLDQCINLEVLDLHGHQIDRIRNLNMLTQLTNLNLANNMIRMIEGLDKLENLKVLNLAKNQIKTIPPSMKHLVSLQELRLNDNIIDNLKTIKSLRPLKNLHHLTIASNPLCEIPHYFLYIIYQIPSLSQLDDKELDESIRNEAKDRFYKEELDELELKFNKMNQENKELKEKLELANSTLEQLTQDYQKSQFNVENLKKENEVMQVDLKTKTKLLDSKTSELIHLSEILYQIQQKLAFFNIDSQFDVSHLKEILQGYDGKGSNAMESSYIGKSYFEKLKMVQDEAETASVNHHDMELLYNHKVIHDKSKSLSNGKNVILNEKSIIQNDLKKLEDDINAHNDSLLQDNVNPFEIQCKIESLQQEKANKELSLQELEKKIKELEHKLLWVESKRNLLSPLDQSIDLNKFNYENDKDFIIKSLKFDLEEKDVDITYMNTQIEKSSRNTQHVDSDLSYNALSELDYKYIKMVKSMIQHFDKSETDPTSMDEACHTGTCNIINTIEELTNRPTEDDISILHHLKVTNFYSIEEEDDENKTKLGTKLRNQAIFLYHQLSRKVNQIKELKSQGFLENVI